MAGPEAAFEPPDDNALTQAIAEARTQVAAGQSIPLADMVRRLESWGTPTNFRRRGAIGWRDRLRTLN